MGTFVKGRIGCGVPAFFSLVLAFHFAVVERVQLQRSSSLSPFFLRFFPCCLTFVTVTGDDDVPVNHVFRGQFSKFAKTDVFLVWFFFSSLRFSPCCDRFFSPRRKCGFRLNFSQELPLIFG